VLTEGNQNGCSIEEEKAMQKTGGWKSPQLGWQRVRWMMKRCSGNSMCTPSEIGK